MSLKRILALASGGVGDDRILAFAAQLANQHGAQAIVAPIYPDSSAEMIALGMALGATLSDGALQSIIEVEQELQGRIDTLARQAADEADVVFGAGDGAPRLSILLRDLRPTLALSHHAALADLILVAHDAIDKAPAKELLSQALLADRAPVLIARGDPDRLAGPAVIAWDGSPQAGRAMRAALPLLAMASGIHVLQCAAGLDRMVANPDIDLLNTYLKLHGVGEGVATWVEGEDEGAALVAGAHARQAGLLVPGAWGHSRLREAVFGGATRSFLKGIEGPSLLLAH